MATKKKYPAAQAKQKKQKELFLKALERTGNIELSCSKSGVPRSNVYRWKNEDPEFNLAIDLAFEQGFEVMNDVAEAALFDAVRSKSVQAIKFMLSRRHPHYSKNRAYHSSFSDDDLTPQEEEFIDQLVDDIGREIYGISDSKSSTSK